MRQPGLIRVNPRLITFFLLLSALISVGVPASAGTLEFDGVPVDITTTANNDLVIVPGTGGNTQIGDLGGGNSQATTNDDLHITGALEVDGRIYADGGITAEKGFSVASWTTDGLQLRLGANTHTDTSTPSSGTAASAVFASFGRPTLAAKNTSVTTTNAATVYIANSPAAGTNQTLTNTYALWVDNGNVQIDGDLAVGGAQTFTGDTTITGDLTVNGNTILGNAGTDTTTINGDTTVGTAAGDTLTFNANTWTLANDTAVTLSGGTDGINFDSNTLSIDASNNRVGIGIASPQGVLQVKQSTDVNLMINTVTSGAITLNAINDANSANVPLELRGSSVFVSTGNVGIIDTSPDYSLEVYQESSGTPTFALSDGDVAHGVTDVVQTDVFAHLSSISTTVGGAYLQGLADATGVALQLRGVQSSDPTDTTPAVSIIGAKKDSAGTGVVDLAAAETVFQVANNDDAAALTVLGDGGVGIGTTAPTGKLNVLSTTEQLRVAYDASNYYSTTVSSAGAVTFNAVGASSAFIMSDKLSVATTEADTSLNIGNDARIYSNTGTLTVGAAANAIIIFGHIASNAYFGIGAAGQNQGFRIQNGNSSQPSIMTTMADGASAVATYVDTSTAWSTAGAKLFSFRTNAVEQAYITYDGGAVFNETGTSTGDVRMEGDTNANLFFLDASADAIGIGDASPAAALTVGDGDDFQVSSTGNLTSPADTTWTLSGGVDALNFDANTLSIDATNNRVGIGTAAPASTLEVVGGVSPGFLLQGSTQGYSSAFFRHGSDTGTDSPNLILQRSEGSVASPTTVSNGSRLGILAGQAYDSNSYETGAAIRFLADGTVADGDVPGRIEFYTTRDGSTAEVERMRISQDGSFIINEDGVATADVRMEGDTDANLFFLDASADAIGIGTNTPTTTKLHVFAADNATAQTITINAAQASVTSSDTFIDFRSTTGSEGSIAGTASAGVIAYNTFTGSHYTLVENRQGLEPNMLLEITGEKIPELPGAPKRQLVKSRISRTRASKAALGVYGGTDKEGRDMILSMGTGFIWVANKRRDVAVGDYLVSSDVPGCAEPQEDDIYRNATVAKATEPIHWKPDERRRLISCIYLGG